MQTRLGLKQQLKVAPQQVLVSTLLQATLVDLDELITKELADNPALERVHPQSAWDDLPPPAPPVHAASAQTESASTLDDWAEQMVDQPSLVEQLTTQLTLLPAGPNCDLAVMLLHYLDNHGYLRVATATLTEELGIEPTALETAIGLLHTLEPPGIGARNLRECLQIQCAHLAADGIDCALVMRILTEAWDAFCQEQWTGIAHQLQVKRAAVVDAQRFIRCHLYPYPLALVSHIPMPTAPVRADLVIQRRIAVDTYAYSIEIAAPAYQRLQINSGFADMLRRANQRDCMLSAEARWLHSHIQRARHFMAALQQRWATLYRIGAYLITYQQAFLTEGALALKPLTQAMAAAALGVHEATVSRAVHDKYVQLPDGRLLTLAAFFDHTLPAKETIRQVLAAANRPLSDQEIADCLHTKGITLARRTVAKYREQLKIPVSYCR